VLNDNGESAAIRCGDQTLLESLVLGLPGLSQSEAVEFDRLGARMLADERSSFWDFFDGKLV